MRFVLLWVLVVAASSVHAQNGGDGTGSAGGATSPGVPATQPGSTASTGDDPVAQLEALIDLEKKMKELVDAQVATETAKNNLLAQKYPVATIAKKSGDATSYEHTSFLANFALTTGVDKLISEVSDELKPHRGAKVVVVDSSGTVAKIQLTKGLVKRASALSKAMRDLLGDDADVGSTESGALAGFKAAEFLTSQTLNLLGYFRTDYEFKAATVSIPAEMFRMRIAAALGARVSDFPGEVGSEFAELDHVQAMLALVDTGEWEPSRKAEAKRLLDAARALIEVAKARCGSLEECQKYADLSRGADKAVVLTEINSGGALYKVSNLWFLSPKIRYVAALSLGYTVADLAGGVVLQSGVRQVKVQLEQSYKDWARHGHKPTVVVTTMATVVPKL